MQLHKPFWDFSTTTNVEQVENMYPMETMDKKQFLKVNAAEEPHGNDAGATLLTTPADGIHAVFSLLGTLVRN